MPPHPPSLSRPTRISPCPIVIYACERTRNWPVHHISRNVPVPDTPRSKIARDDDQISTLGPSKYQHQLYMKLPTMQPKKINREKTSSTPPDGLPSRPRQPPPLRLRLISPKSAIFSVVETAHHPLHRTSLGCRLRSRLPLSAARRFENGIKPNNGISNLLRSQ